MDSLEDILHKSRAAHLKARKELKTVTKKLEAVIAELAAYRRGVANFIAVENVHDCKKSETCERVAEAFTTLKNLDAACDTADQFLQAHAAAIDAVKDGLMSLLILRANVSHAPVVKGAVEGAFIGYQPKAEAALKLSGIDPAQVHAELADLEERSA